MVNRHPVTEPFWHPLEGSGMKLFLFMHLLRIATTLGDQIWGVMLTSTFGRGPCTYLGFLKGFLWEYPTKNQHQAALLWLVQRWYLQEMKTDGIEIDIGIMNGVMSACHLLSFFWSLFLNGWKSVVVSIERIEIFDFFRCWRLDVTGHDETQRSTQVKRRINGVICSWGHPFWGFWEMPSETTVDWVDVGSKEARYPPRGAIAWCPVA